MSIRHAVLWSKTAWFYCHDSAPTVLQYICWSLWNQTKCFAILLYSVLPLEWDVTSEKKNAIHFLGLDFAERFTAGGLKKKNKKGHYCWVSGSL